MERIRTAAQESERERERWRVKGALKETEQVDAAKQDWFGL